MVVAPSSRSAQAFRTRQRRRCTAAFGRGQTGTPQNQLKTILGSIGISWKSHCFAGNTFFGYLDSRPIRHGNFLLDGLNNCRFEHIEIMLDSCFGCNGVLPSVLFGSLLHTIAPSLSFCLLLTLSLAFVSSDTRRKCKRHRFITGLCLNQETSPGAYRDLILQGPPGSFLEGGEIRSSCEKSQGSGESQGQLDVSFS